MQRSFFLSPLPVCTCPIIVVVGYNKIGDEHDWADDGDDVPPNYITNDYWLWQRPRGDHQRESHHTKAVSSAEQRRRSWSSISGCLLTSIPPPAWPVADGMCCPTISSSSLQVIKLYPRTPDDDGHSADESSVTVWWPAARESRSMFARKELVVDEGFFVEKLLESILYQVQFMLTNFWYLINFYLKKQNSSIMYLLHWIKLNYFKICGIGPIKILTHVFVFPPAKIPQKYSGWKI